jgi:hypothetical protein
MEYDAHIGCLILLNTALQEMVLFWEATGAVTTMENIPWVFLAGGPDVMTDGPQRCYLVTAAGKVHCIDSARQMGKRTMYGAAVGDTVNGTVTTASATTITDSVANFSLNCVGFKVYILSGALIGETATITARPSAQSLTVSGLSGTTAIGDRYAIAPIVSRATLPQLQTPNGNDAFVTKVVSSLALASSNHGGEIANGDPNAMVTIGVKRDSTILSSSEVRMSTSPNRQVVRVNYRANRMHPFIEFKGANIDFEVQALQVKGQLGLSEAELRQG